MKITPLFVRESTELRSSDRARFEKQFASYKIEIARRMKTFERHGATGTAAYEKLQSALYEARQSRSAKAKEYSLSHMSFTLTSSRSSYAKNLEVDRKIVQRLNEQYGKGFITLKDLPTFGRMMQELRDSSWDSILSSDELAEIIMSAKNPNNNSVEDWHKSLYQKLRERELLGDDEDDV